MNRAPRQRDPASIFYIDNVKVGTRGRTDLFADDFESDEITSPFTCQCVGIGGCYEVIPPGMVHECDPHPLVRLWRRLRRRRNES